MSEEPKKKGFWAKHLWDIIVIGVFAIAATGLSIWSALPKEAGHIALITVKGIEAERIDLSYESETERTISIQGAVDEIQVGIKYNAIRIIEAHCPTQYCVNEGYITGPGRPIVCAYNQVVIEILGESESDVIIG